MRQFNFLIATIISCVVGSLTGCVIIPPLEPGAEKIVMIDRVPSKQCKLVGYVTSTDVNGVTQIFTSHEALQQNEINTLKNRALALGANTIVLVKHKTTYTRQGGLSWGNPNNPNNPIRVDTHVMSGKAYQCIA